MILNEPFIADPSPVNLLKSASEYSESTYFLIVGGDGNVFDHLAPNCSAENTSGIVCTDHPNLKSCHRSVQDDLQSQRSLGFCIARAKPMRLEVAVKKRSLLTPSKQRFDRVLAKGSQKLAKWLEKTDPPSVHSYAQHIEWRCKEDETS